MAVNQPLGFRGATSRSPPRRRLRLPGCPGLPPARLPGCRLAALIREPFKSLIWCRGRGLALLLVVDPQPRPNRVDAGNAHRGPCNNTTASRMGRGPGQTPALAQPCGSTPPPLPDFKSYLRRPLVAESVDSPIARGSSSWGPPPAGRPAHSPAQPSPAWAEPAHVVCMGRIQMERNLKNARTAQRVRKKGREDGSSINLV